MSLNQILEQIKSYFKTHPQINQVNLTIDDDDFNALTGLVYPVVNIQYVDSDAEEDRFQHNLKIIIADLTNPNVEGIDFEIYSDCLQISADFFKWLEDNYSFDAIRTSNFQPFTDSNVDRTSGIVFNLGIFAWANKDIDCAIPTPTPTPTPTATPTPTPSETPFFACQCFKFVNTTGDTKYLNINRCNEYGDRYYTEILAPFETKKLCLYTEGVGGIYGPYYDLPAGVTASICNIQCTSWYDPTPCLAC